MTQTQKQFLYLFLTQIMLILLLGVLFFFYLEVQNDQIQITTNSLKETLEEVEARGISSLNSLEWKNHSQDRAIQNLNIKNRSDLSSMANQIDSLETRLNFRDYYQNPNEQVPYILGYITGIAAYYVILWWFGG